MIMCATSTTTGTSSSSSSSSTTPQTTTTTTRKEGPSSSSSSPSPPPPPPPPQRQSSMRMRRQNLCSVLLDSVTAISVLLFIFHDPSYLDPWDLSDVTSWTAGFAFVRLGVLFYDHLVVYVIEKFFGSDELLPTRRPGAPPVRYVGLDARSIAYLGLNSINEYVFVMRLTHYLWLGGRRGMLSWRMNDLTPWNTIFALGIMFVSMDAMYAPLHHVMHHPALYPLVHKHHHRQHYPARGYLDAGNEHPIEHMIGVMCTWFAVCSSEVLLPTCVAWLGRVMMIGSGSGGGGYGNYPMIEGGGVHALTVVLFFQFHAALACMNHGPYDVKFSLPFVGSAGLLGSGNVMPRGGADGDVDGTTGKWFRRMITGQWFQYSVGHHEMHHRKFNYNYGQYCMFYDSWMGTFVEYEGPLSAAQLEAKKRNSVKDE